MGPRPALAAGPMIVVTRRHPASVYTAVAPPVARACRRVLRLRADGKRTVISSGRHVTSLSEETPQGQSGRAGAEQACRGGERENPQVRVM